MINILSKSFSSFLSGLDLNVHSSKPKEFIISFINDITDIYDPAFGKKLLNAGLDLSENNKCFYYHDSKNECEIFASGLCFSLTHGKINSYDDIRQSELSDFSVIDYLEEQSSYVSSILCKNWSECCSEFIPLIVGGLKFNSKDSEKWKDFKYCEWYIPEITIFTTNQKNRLSGRIEKNSHQDSSAIRSYLLVNFRITDNSEVENLITKFNGILNIFRYPMNNSDENRDKNTQGSGITFLSHFREEMKRNFSVFSDEVDNASEYNGLQELSKWTSLVNKGKASILDKETEKIVFAREVTVKLVGVGNPESLKYFINSFVEKKIQNNCNKYLLRDSDSLYFGCSPEKLFSAKGKTLETEAVAGSSPKSQNPEEDKKNEALLFGSDKDIKEHKYVVSFIVNALKEFCEEIIYSGTPKIKKLSNLQHLWTPIEAKLKSIEYEGVNRLPVYRLIKALFPTPAVCGLPVDKSYQIICNEEKFERGLYSGLVGWFNFYSAHLTVSIRGILINKNEVSIFAGCGIVEDSIPENEFEETILKIKNILKILDYES